MKAINYDSKELQDYYQKNQMKTAESIHKAIDETWSEMETAFKDRNLTEIERLIKKFRGMETEVTVIFTSESGIERSLKARIKLFE